jgi:hypothetical protein
MPSVSPGLAEFLPVVGNLSAPHSLAATHAGTTSVRQS